MECDSMRAFLVALVFTACDAGDPRPASYNPHGITGAEATSEPAAGTEAIRLDLPVYETSTTGVADLSTSTGAASSSGEPAPDLGAMEASTGEAPGSSSSTGGESTGTSGSTGEPDPPDVCGDGQCTGGETIPACWEPGWCPGDCLKQPKCISDCPCAPGITTFCNLAPGVCSATKPGGYCDPNGDGQFFDGDFTKGNLEHTAKCG